MKLFDRIKTWGALFGVVGVASCSVHRPAPAPPAAPPPPQPAPSARAPAAPPAPVLGPSIRSADELRRHAAKRLVEANPQGSYLSRPPDILLAIPVIEVELRADGSVKKTTVIRKPRQAFDTVQIAIDAIHRAAPYGDLRRLPEPRVFTETFLFDDQRRFKPRTLD